MKINRIVCLALAAILVVWFALILVANEAQAAPSPSRTWRPVRTHTRTMTATPTRLMMGRADEEPTAWHTDDPSTPQPTDTPADLDCIMLPPPTDDPDVPHCLTYTPTPRPTTPAATRTPGPTPTRERWG